MLLPPKLLMAGVLLSPFHRHPFMEPSQSPAGQHCLRFRGEGNEGSESFHNLPTVPPIKNAKSLKSISDSVQSKHSFHNTTLPPRNQLNLYFLIRRPPLGSHSIWKVPCDYNYLFSLWSPVLDCEFLKTRALSIFSHLYPQLCLHGRTERQVSGKMG